MRHHSTRALVLLVALFPVVAFFCGCGKSHHPAGGENDVGTEQERQNDRKSDPVTLRLTLKGHAGEVRAVQFSPEGSILATGSRDGTLILWDALHGTRLKTINEPGHWWGPIAFTPDGKTMIAGDQEGVVKMWDVDTAEAKGVLKSHRGIIELITCLKDGKTLVTADENGSVSFWDMATGKKLPQRDANVGDTLCLAITADGKTLISTGTYDDAATVKVWDLATGKQTGTLKGHDFGVLDLAVTPDGRALVSCTRGRPAKLWDLASRKELAALAGHAHDVFAVTTTADGKSVVTGSLDGTVKVWDVATGSERLTLEGEPYAGMVLSVGVSPDGKMVAAGRDDATVSLWHLSQNASLFAPQGTKAEIAKAPLTDEQRRAFRAKMAQLSEMGPEGVSALAKELREGERERKIAALLALRNLGPDAEPALDSVMGAFDSEDLDVKRLAIVVLGAMGPKAKSALPALIEAAKETRDFDGSFASGGSSNVAEAALEAVRVIDPDSMPPLADAMIPGLLEVVKEGRGHAPSNALALLRQLGPLAKPALPKLKELLGMMSAEYVREVVPVFLAADEEGMAILADLITDPATSDETRIRLMEGYRWERRTTPSSERVFRTLLSDDNPAVRAAAVSVLEGVRSEALVPRLAELLEDTDLLRRVSDSKGEDEFHVARALANQGKAAVPLLTKALEHDVPLVRFQAARALALMGKDAREAALDLEKLLDDPLPPIQMEAALAVLKSGTSSEESVKKLGSLVETDARLSFLILDALDDLGRVGYPLFPAVKRVTLQSQDYQIQLRGFQAIEAMRADPKEIVEIWIELLKKNPWFLSHCPKAAVGERGEEARAALPLLLGFLKDPDVNTRHRATKCLAAMGPAAEKAIPELIQALDDHSFVAYGAMEALGAMGSLAQPAVAPLMNKFEAVQPGEREASFRKREILTALERIGPGAAEAVPRLLLWLPENPAAARVLGQIGPDADSAVPALERMFHDGTTDARVFSAFALVKITGKTDPYVPALAEVFQRNKTPRYRGEALRALVELGPDARAALPAFLQALKTKRPPGLSTRDFRREAATALVHFGPEAKEAVPYLIEMVRDSYYTAKIAAADALGAIGPEAREAIPALEQMAEEDPDFREIAERALLKIRAK